MRYFNEWVKLLAVTLLAAASMLQYASAIAADTLIRDNGGPGSSSTGTWKRSSGAHPYGHDSYYANSNGASYTYVFDLDKPGKYQVYARWTEWHNRRTRVPYDIHHLDGKTTVTVNQRQHGGKWQKLGDTWTFGDSATIRIRSRGHGTTSADAIKLVYVGGNVTGPAFPVVMRGSRPEEASIVLHVSKPADASNATISLVTYDADFPDEGELIINGNAPVSLFGNAGTRGNDQNAANIRIQGIEPDTGSASLSWTAPVARTDGSALALSEIAGYTVYYGKSAGNYSHSMNVNGGSSTSATIKNLTTGTYYMVVTTRDSAGRESGRSSRVTKQVH